MEIHTIGLRSSSLQFCFPRTQLFLSETDQANTGVAVLVRKSTGTKRQKGEDLISDPKLRKEFAALKKKAAKKNP